MGESHWEEKLFPMRQGVFQEVPTPPKEGFRFHFQV